MSDDTSRQPDTKSWSSPSKIETDSRLSALQLDSKIGDHKVGRGHARVAPTTAQPRCANACCLARTKLLHVMTTTWWHRTPTAASGISSGLTGSPRAQVVGTGDSGSERRSRTSSTRENVLHLFNFPAWPTPFLERTSTSGSSTPIPPRRDYGPRAVATLLLEEIHICPFSFHPIAFSSRSLALKTNVAWVRWPLLELAAGTLMIGTHVIQRHLA